jgi:hypothetical protein
VSNWARVSQLMQAAGCGRDANQCLQRWNFSVNPAIRRGEWEPIEDSRLRAAVQGMGPPEAGRGGSGGKGKGSYWAAVSRAVGGRTQAQCRERWCNVLDPSLERSPFSPEEDARLLAAVELYGERWSVVQRHAELVNRTDAMVAKRYHQITKPRGARGPAPGGARAGGRKRGRAPVTVSGPDTAGGAQEDAAGGETNGGTLTLFLGPDPPSVAPAPAAGRATARGGRGRRSSGRAAGRGGRAAAGGQAPILAQVAGDAPMYAHMGGGAPVSAQVAGEVPILAQVAWGAPTLAHAAGEGPVLAQVAGRAPTRAQVAREAQATGAAPILAQVAHPPADGGTAVEASDAELRRVVTVMAPSKRACGRAGERRAGTSGHVSASRRRRGD